MSGKAISVSLEDRKVLGKGLAKIRGEGKVPAVIHDHGKPSIHVMGDYIGLLKAYGEAGKHHPVELHVGDTQHLALIKDVDFEPVKRTVRHMVFQAIKQNEEVEAEIPVVFKEDVEIPAQKASLMVLQQLDHVEVKALPRDLPDQLVVDPSSLAEVGDHLRVSDIVVPEGVTILTDLEHQIAIVEMPKDQEAEANAAAEALAEDAAEHAEGEEGETPANSDEEAHAEESASETPAPATESKEA